MAKKQTKLVDTLPHCTYLTEPPETNGEYQTGSARRFYICAVNSEPCIARHLQDMTVRGDIFGYATPIIIEEKLEECPLHNLPIDIVEQIMRTKNDNKIKKIKADLEKRLESLRENN
ncbi:hypothetical protein GOV03_00275 [Candidatus Woesearchaeota archaeon]|nr:hypothetical protein [Candidatus Woesearchaeota archaeon]